MNAASRLAEVRVGAVDAAAGRVAVAGCCVRALGFCATVINRSRDLDLIVNGIKDLAMDLDMAAVVLSQMNRKADETYGRPNMSHLRESGAIEAAADQIALLFTDWAHPQSKRLPELQGYSELEIVAHRNGPQGLVPLRFIGRHQHITDWDGPLPRRMAAGPSTPVSKTWRNEERDQ